jgi:tetratricopeptide (TPR) repeat protein
VLSQSLYQDSLNSQTTAAAVKKLSAAIAIDRTNVDAYRSRAAHYVALKNWQGAIADYTVLLSYERSALIYRSRGAAYSNMGAIAEAIADFDRAIRFDPNLYRTWLDRGALKLKLLDLDGAIADISKSISLSPDHPQGYVVRATAYRQARKYQLALRDMDVAIALNPHERKYFAIKSAIELSMRQINSPQSAIVERIERRTNQRNSSILDRLKAFLLQSI